MSWLDKIKTDLTITCGDGQDYAPAWMNASKQVEYNVAQYEFDGIDGTLVERKRPKGAAYNLEVYFQGDDHLDIAEAFEKSAADSRAWTLTHPFYGAILVQPISLVFDNSALNVSKITGMIVQTIGGGELRPKVSVPNKIEDDKFITDSNLATTFSNDLPAKKVSVLQELQGNVNNLYNNISKSIADTTDLSEYFNKYNEVNALINGTVYDALALIQQVQDLISMPARFAQSIEDRLTMFQLQLSLLSSGVDTITNRDYKKVYENNAGTVITGAVLSAVLNIGTAYVNRVDVLNMIDSIYDMYTTYTTNLDSLQTTTGGNPDSYIPDPDSVTSIANLVGYAIEALTDFASDSRQERVIFLEEDSNAVLLAHRFYGLKPDDSTIDEFMLTNGIGLNEVLNIRKGRRIVYYINSQ